VLFSALYSALRLVAELIQFQTAEKAPAYNHLQARRSANLLTDNPQGAIVN